MLLYHRLHCHHQISHVFMCLCRWQCATQCVLSPSALENGRLVSDMAFLSRFFVRHSHSILAPICCTAYNSRDICEPCPKQWSVTGWIPTLTASVLGVRWPAPFYIRYYQMFDVDRQPLLSFPVKLAQQFAKSRLHCCTCLLEITSASFMLIVPVMVHGFMLCVQRDQTTACIPSRLHCTLGQ